MMKLFAAVLFCLLSLNASAANVFLFWRDGDTGDFERVVLDVIPEYVLGFDASGVPEMVEAGGGGGSGDVVGPASAVADRIALFDGITGKLLSDGGSTISDVLSRANHTGTQLLSTISDAGTLAGLSAVTTTQITDGTIANADISGSAAIALSKLATDPLARANHTGTQDADTLTDGTTNKAFLATERTKLAGIATGATANSADATLLDRANHTGTQAAGTITGLAASATTDTTSATNISSGTLGDGRLSANVPLINAANTFTGANTISTNGAVSAPAFKLTGSIYTGGTGTSTKPIFLVEPSGTTSTAWSTAGTLMGLNCATGFSGNLLDLQNNGVFRFSFGRNGDLLARSSISLGAASDVTLYRDAAGTLQLGADGSTPTAQTVKSPDAAAGVDTNTAGSILNIAAGRGTGTAAGGVLNLQTSEPTSSGTAAGTLTTRLALSGTAITASLPVTLKAYTVATLPTGVPGDTAYVTDATAPTYLGALTGGGSVYCPVFRNASGWVSH